MTFLSLGNDPNLIRKILSSHFTDEEIKVQADPVVEGATQTGKERRT